jgi:hypothetical protein
MLPETLEKDICNRAGISTFSHLPFATNWDMDIPHFIFNNHRVAL